MSELKAGDTFPEGVAFTYVAVTPENSDITSCGIPTKYDASQGTLFLALKPSGRYANAN